MREVSASPRLFKKWGGRRSAAKKKVLCFLGMSMHVPVFWKTVRGVIRELLGLGLATESSGDYVNLMVIEYPFLMGSSPIEKVNPANKEPKVLLTNSVGSNYPAFNRFRIYKGS